MDTGTGVRRRSTVLAFAGGGLAVAQVIAAVALTLAVGWSLRQATDAFVTSNTVIGFSFAVCGLLLAWQRPANPIGWLLLADGLGHATTAVAAPLAQVLADAHAPVGAQRAAVTVFAWSWPWSIALALPLALLLFPDGQPPSPRWRPAVLAVVLSAPLFVAELGMSPRPLAGLPDAYLTLGSYDRFAPLWTVSEVRTLAAMAVALAALVVRYRRGGDTERRQLLWLLLATMVAVAAFVPWSLVAGTPIVVLLAIPLIPAAITVAILRHQLLDIRLVVARAVTWLLLSAGVVLAYLGLVAALDALVSARISRSVIATLVVALLASPVRGRLQRAVDRAMYGDRRDPLRAASRVGERLSGAEPSLAAVAAALQEALRLPYAALHIDGRPPAADGPRTHSVPLDYAGKRVGELVVGLRPGERRASPADRRVLALVAAPLAAAVHATGLSEQLQASRERLVSAREEERRRLRRDLHDGLGPTLTGVAFAADAAANLVPTDPARAVELLAALRADTRGAIAEIRRLVDDLRPPALDELGLLGALRQRLEQLSWRSDGAAIEATLEAPERLPALPAAIEVAAYRIATEALTNTVRHSRATRVVVRLDTGAPGPGALDIEVLDNGPAGAPWRPGVGLRAMHERAAELGGRYEAGPSAAGGLVRVRLPLGTR
jgi:two-component system NarL family sensor kinase